MRSLSPFLAVLLWCVSAHAVSNTVNFAFKDFSSTPQNLKNAQIYFLDYDTETSTNLVVRDRVTKTPTADGLVTVTNYTPGKYRVEFTGLFTTTTNWFDFPATNGTINAKDWKTSPTNTPAGLAYTIAAANAAFMAKSNGIASVASFVAPTSTNTLTLLNMGIANACGVYTFKGNSSYGGNQLKTWTNTTGYAVALDPNGDQFDNTWTVVPTGTTTQTYNTTDPATVAWSASFGFTTPPRVSYFGSPAIASSGPVAADLYDATNYQAGNLVGSLPVSVLGILNSNNIVTNGLSAYNLDNDTWLSVQKGVVSGPFGKSMNRFGWTNTINKINAGSRFTIMGIGDGLTYNRMLNTAIYSLPTNAFNFAGYKSTYIFGPFHMISSVTASSQTATWVKNYFDLGLNNVVTFTNDNDPQGIVANLFNVQYVTDAGKGHFRVETQINGGTWTTVSGLNNVDASAASPIGAVAWWTNSVPAKTQFRVTQLDAGKTVSILDGAAIDTTVTNGFCGCSYYGNSSVTIAQQQGTPSILAPIMRAWDPDLILYQKIGMDIAYFLPLLNFIHTNTPLADMVFCGIYPLTSTTPGADTTTYGEFDYQRTNAFNIYRWSAFDGHAAFLDTNNVFLRGWEAANDVHFSTVGMAAYDQLLTTWLGLSETTPSLPATLNASSLTIGTVPDARLSANVSLLGQTISLAEMANMNTGKLLGRSTAGSGVPEELTIGAGLSLAAGTLANTISVNTSFTTLTDGATITWTCDSTKNIQNAKVTLAGNRTLAFASTAAGMTGVLIVTQDGTGTRTLALPASSKVIGGGVGVITLTTTAAAVDVLSWVYDGTTYWWNYGKNYN